MINPKEIQSTPDSLQLLPEEQLQDEENAIAKRRRIIYPPAVGTMGTPAFATRSDLAGLAFRIGFAQVLPRSCHPTTDTSSPSPPRSRVASASSSSAPAG